jgi:hypothetical protein
MYYCGLLKNTKVVEVFYSNNKPAEKSYGNLYGFLFGGYKTKQEAFNVANYQFSYCNVRFYDARKKSCITDHNLYAIAGIE